MLSDGSAWRTLDGGSTYESLQSDLRNDFIRGVELAYDGSKIFMLTTGAWMWTSVDGGATFVNESVPYYVHDMMMHPSVPSRILATGLTNCCQQSLACTTCKAVLLLSVDEGASWRVLLDYLFFRGELAYSWAPVLNSTVDKSFAYVRYISRVGDQRLLFGEPMNLNLVPDYDDLSRFIEVPNGGPFVWEGTTYMMARVTTGRPGLSSVSVSADAGQSFSVVAFPPVSSFNSHRIWLATESGNPFLGVFDGPDYEDGMVYVSTGPSMPFTISLRKVIQRLNKQHWTHIGSAIPGTYIANHHPTSDGLTTVTVISYNHGGHWHDLKLTNAVNSGSVPSPVVQGDIDDSEEDDFDDVDRVHLAAPFPGPKFFTSPSAPGLIVASGQIGPLLTDWSGQTVLVSRDAGRTWTASLNGSFVLFGTNGGTVLLAIEDSSFTTLFHYSINFGTTWSTCTFSSVPVTPLTMRSNFEEETSPFAILDAVDANGKFHIFTINMTSVYNRSCTFADFTDWALRDANGEMCVFGRQMVFSHRAQNARCQKTAGQDRLIVSSPCNCGSEDFICSFCYARRSSASRCDFLWDDCDTGRPIAPDNCTDSWRDYSNPANLPSPDSMCVGGMSVNDIPSIISCPPPPVVDIPPPPYSTLQNDVLVTVSAISIALCGIVIVGIYYCIRNSIGAAPPPDLEGWKSANHSKPISSPHHHQHAHAETTEGSSSPSSPSSPTPDEEMTPLDV